MIKKTSKRLLFSMTLALAFTHVGAIRHDEDPVLRTQTAPIELQQKLEETKDGVKAAPAPTFKYYEKEDFLTRSPMGTAKEKPISNSKSQNDLNTVTEVETREIGKEGSDAVLEETAETDTESKEAVSEEEDDWWVEDDAQDLDQK